MKNAMIPKCLSDVEAFTRKEYCQAMLNECGFTEQQSKYELQKALNCGKIIRKGWNQYIATNNKRVYTYDYSSDAKEIAELLEEKYYNINFQMFETKQLNQFMNHLVAHNTIFVAVENDLIEFIFDALNKKYPGRVMLKPSLEMYYRYIQDNEIVVVRLPSETPKGINKPWKTKIEKILVDILTDKLIGKIVPESEKSAIVEGAYSDFIIDEATMMRYAKRKGAEGKIVNMLSEYGRTIAV